MDNIRQVQNKINGLSLKKSSIDNIFNRMNEYSDLRKTIYSSKYNEPANIFDREARIKEDLILVVHTLKDMNIEILELLNYLLQKEIDLENLKK